MSATTHVLARGPDRDDSWSCGLAKELLAALLRSRGRMVPCPTCSLPGDAHASWCHPEALRRALAEPPSEKEPF
jgi:hypothetical protein